jgi:pimeloyl-ACP methyl ester carboxylesterase
VGTWLGTIELGPQRVQVVLRISRKKDGSLTGKLDVVGGARDQSVDDLTWKDGRLQFARKATNATYEGKVDPSEAEVVGHLRQGGRTLPLNFKRGDKTPEPPKRPQEPRKPYPYREEEVAYENKAAGVKLAGTLTLPPGKGPFPAVLLITGSGPQDRDETVLGHKPFLVLADYLTRRGIAVLRVDDRGVGGSTGNTLQSTTEDFCGDALAGVAFLKGRQEINPRQVGLVGHSEGGLVAPLAASRSDDVAFIVMLAGTGLPGEALLVAQNAAVLRVDGAGEDTVAQDEILVRKMIAVARGEKDQTEAVKKVKAIADEQAKLLARANQKPTAGGRREPAGKRHAFKEKEAFDADVAALIGTPWFRFLIDYDPRPALRKVRCPVLALNGDRDVEVVARENLPAIEKALKEGGNKDFTVLALPGLNHMFQTCKTGAGSEISSIEETLAPAALRTVGDWISKHTSVGSPAAGRWRHGYAGAVRRRTGRAMKARRLPTCRCGKPAPRRRASGHPGLARCSGRVSAAEGRWPSRARHPARRLPGPLPPAAATPAARPAQRAGGRPRPGRRPTHGSSGRCAPAARPASWRRPASPFSPSSGRSRPAARAGPPPPAPRRTSTPGPGPFPCPGRVRQAVEVAQAP